jgi:hypothetical protein
VRYEADLPTQVHVTQAGETVRVPAQVRDISPGGVQLCTDRPFQPGQIVSLELPAAGGDEDQTVLACVVRTAPEADGQWAIGCAFSRELSEADLEAFGIGKPQGAAADQRTWVRHESNLTVTFIAIGAGDGRSAMAKVLNVSASGIGLLVSEAIEAGSLLQLDLHDPQGRFVRTILACVVHSTRRSSGELVAGCNFIRELGEAELEALL